ncbi:hypothetical protein QQ045_011680 [Rhodiola kirilowii]
MDDYLHPRPIDSSLLTTQNVHRTEAIWRNQMDIEFMSDKPLRVASHNVVNLNPRLVEYVANARFLPWTQVSNVKIDPKLCTALVERWRPETHTFHLNGGEATITLQDVALLTGLPIDGEPVSGLGELEWKPVCLSLLGAMPDCPQVKSMGSKTWFDNCLTNMPDDVDEETLKKYARAYILCLLRLTLLSDLYGDQVVLHYLLLLTDLDYTRRYSWGSVILSFQYSQLCKASNLKQSQIGGCALLLQFWSWERMRIGAPQPYFREAPDLEDDIHLFLRPCWSYLHWVGPKNFQEVPHGALVLFRDQLERMVHGDDDDMSLDDDHVTNLESHAAGYDRPSSSRAPPSPPFRPSTSHAPPSPPFRPSTSQAPPSPPAHGHQLRPQKSLKQSWLKRLRRQRFGRD